jgi:hypothetical protein
VARDRKGGRTTKQETFVLFRTWSWEVNPLNFKPKSGWRIAFLVMIRDIILQDALFMIIEDA